MIPSLKNPKLRLERAKEHLDILHVEIREFLNTKPPSITTEENTQDGLYILRCQIPTIDPRLAIIAGDAVDNLRSVLDHIAWQVALTIGRRPYKRTAFPIVDENTTKKMRTFDDITKDIPPTAIDKIKAFQPYHRGTSYKTHPLWILDELCNINKHRVIPAEGTCVEFKIPKGIVPTFQSALNNCYIVATPISVKAQMQFTPAPTFDILLGSRIDGLVISIRELTKIYEYIRGEVLPTFVRFFPE